MNVWEQEEIVSANDDANSKFLNKALRDGDSIKLTFINVQHEDQREETPDEYKNPDGKEWVLYFTDEEGNERVMAQRSTKGKLFQALRGASIQPDQKIIVTRVGTGIDTDYEVALDSETPTTTAPAVAPKGDEEEPF